VAKRFAEHLTAIGVATPTLTEREQAKLDLRCDYEAYLRQHRGLSERTIGHCWRFADRFLDFCFGGAARRVASTAALIATASSMPGTARARS
jgi:hypothetical protein